MHHIWPRRLPDKGILHLILNVEECKLYLKTKVDGLYLRDRYLIGKNIDLKNTEFNMAVSAGTRVGEEIELIAFEIVQK